MSKVARIFTRGMLLESHWNPEHRQRGAVEWIVGRPHAETAEQFNANPTLAGYALGPLASGDEDADRNSGVLTAAISGVGDRLVWGLLRPLAVVSSILASLAGAIPAALVLLLVYNPAELALRWRACACGLAGSAAVLRDLGDSGLAQISRRLARLGAGVVGFLCGFWLWGEIAEGRFVNAAASAVGTVIVWLLLSRRLGTWSSPLTALVLAIVWIAFRLIGANG